MKLRTLGVLAAVAALAFSACNQRAGGAAAGGATEGHRELRHRAAPAGQ